jgi:hypothetical protein
VRERLNGMGPGYSEGKVEPCRTEELRREREDISALKAQMAEVNSKLDGLVRDLLIQKLIVSELKGLLAPGRSPGGSSRALVERLSRRR